MNKNCYVKAKLATLGLDHTLTADSIDDAYRQAKEYFVSPFEREQGYEISSLSIREIGCEL